MGQPKSEYAYPEAKALMDRALLEEKGLRVTFSSKQDAVRLRFNCYTARNRERAAHARMFPPDDPLHNKSPWETLTFLVRQSKKRNCHDLLMVKTAYLPASAEISPIDDEDLNFLEDAGYETE